jgi:hypothetical protein
MRRIALFAALAALVAAPVWAQSTQPAEKAPEKATAPLKVKVEPNAKMEAGMPTKTENIKPVYRPLTKKSYLDARKCLQKKTNEDIIVCAEKFL